MILDDIVANKRMELEKTAERVPLSEVRELSRHRAPAKDFASALRGDDINIIAEVKKASPSKGLICADFDPVSIARVYAANGAAAISVLTESKYFQGDIRYLDDLQASLGTDGPPLLRKDFIFDPYQIYEARAHGADAILLIAAVLPPAALVELIDLTHALGMEALVEVHNEKEMGAALSCDCRVIGINNRDLKTFKVDITTTERLSKLVTTGKIVVSESGITTRADVKRLRGCGVDAVLVGEALMSAPDVPAKMKELL